MTIAVTGASGLVGRHLVQRLRDAGHDVRAVSRSAGEGLRWDPVHGIVDPAAWEGLDGVVHLAGESIGQRWTRAAKQRIWDSRVPATETLSRGLAALEQPPEVLVCANAVGYYGDRPTPVGEDAPAGDGWLAEICDAWQAACDPAREAGIRVANIRTSFIIAPEAAAFKRLVLPFKLGVGGPIAGGRQYFPWIHIDDEVRAIQHILRSDLEGPVNLVAPDVRPQKGFAKTLGQVLHRPSFMPLPRFAVRILLGQMGIELLSYGQHVAPERLLDAGFSFRFPDAETALRDALGRPTTAK